MSASCPIHVYREPHEPAGTTVPPIAENPKESEYAISDNALRDRAEASEALRLQERQEWQQVIRVLSHEINNSLAPITSIARTLSRMASNPGLDRSLGEPMSHGLDVIHERAECLSRFLKSYTRLAAVPTPVRQKVPLADLVAHVAALETRLEVNVASGTKVDICVDPDQLQQALINLIKNAADAVLLGSDLDLSPEAVTVSCKIHSQDIEICIEDEGTGLAETENLLPFCTTKKSGSGIGLLLTRQIIEAHQGTLVLTNRQDHSGCRAEVKLPKCVVGVSEASSHHSRLEA